MGNNANLSRKRTGSLAIHVINLVTSAASWPDQLRIMSLAVDVACFIAVAQVDQQLLTSATLEAGHVPRRFRCGVWCCLGYHDGHSTGFNADTAASADLDAASSSSSFNSQRKFTAITKQQFTTCVKSHISFSCRGKARQLRAYTITEFHRSRCRERYSDVTGTDILTYLLTYLLINRDRLLSELQSAFNACTGRWCSWCICCWSCCICTYAATGPR